MCKSFSHFGALVLTRSQRCHPRISKGAEYWNPHNLGYLFLAEAKRLWERENGQVKVTIVQAALFLNGICNLDGLDSIGWQYTVQAIRVADSLGLFESLPHDTDPDLRISYEFTAWTLFCWQRYA